MHLSWEWEAPGEFSWFPSGYGCPSDDAGSKLKVYGICNECGKRYSHKALMMMAESVVSYG